MADGKEGSGTIGKPRPDLRSVSTKTPDLDLSVDPLRDLHQEEDDSDGNRQGLWRGVLED